jgi:hypothetical protein
MSLISSMAIRAGDRHVQAVPSQPRDRAEQLRLVGRAMKFFDVDLVVQVERWCVDPERPAGPRWGL